MKLQFFTVFPQYLGLLTVEEWQQFNNLVARSSPYFLSFRAREPVGREFARLIDEAQGSQLCARCDLLHFWADLAAHFLKSPSGESSGDAGLRQRLRHLLGRTPVVELAKCSSADLAVQLNCSLRHFRRLFREEFGVPFRETQMELRLMRARQLLTESTSPIVAIADQCGYRHMSFFRSMFKKRFGMAPAEWRRQAQANGPSEIRLSR